MIDAIFNRGKHVLLGLLSNLLQVLIGKVIAFGLGPTGILLFSNIKQLIQIFSSLLTLNSENLVVIQIARHGFNISNIKVIFSKFRITSIVALILIYSFLTIRNKYMPDVLTGDIFKYLFLISSILFALNIIAFSILNGINKLIAAYKNQITGYFLALVVLFFCMNFKVLTSELIVIYFFIVTLITFSLNLFVLHKCHIESKITSAGLVQQKSGLIFSRTSVLLIFIVYLIGNVSQFFLRNQFVEFYSIKTAGLIDSAITLSNYFTTIVISIFTVNSLASLSTVSDSNDIKLLTNRILYTAFFLLLCSNAVLFIFRLDLLRLFYTDGFLVIHDFYGCLIIGDIFKILAGILMVISLTFGKVWLYFIIAMIGNLFTLFPFIVYKFDILLDIGFFYIIANSMFFICSLFLFYFCFKSKKIVNI